MDKAEKRKPDQPASGIPTGSRASSLGGLPHISNSAALAGLPRSGGGPKGVPDDNGGALKSAMEAKAAAIIAGPRPQGGAPAQPTGGTAEPDTQTAPELKPFKERLAFFAERAGGTVSGKKSKPPAQQPPAEETPAEEIQDPLMKGMPSPPVKYEAKGKGLLSSTEYTGVGEATDEWKKLPTVIEFRKRTSVFAVMRGSELKGVESALNKYHALADGNQAKSMTDRINLYCALRQVKAACAAYFASGGPFSKKRRAVVEEVNDKAERAMASLSGGARKGFDFAATNYQMEQDANNGMKEEDFKKKYFAEKDTEFKMSEATYDNMTSVMGQAKDEEMTPDMAQAAAILGTLRKEEIGSLQDQMKGDDLMSKILQEISETQDSVHYTVSAAPKVYSARAGDDPRHVMESRLFNALDFYNPSKKQFAHRAQMDNVHESTHVAVAHAFKGRGRSYAVPVQELGKGDEAHKDRAMSEIKKVVHERNESSEKLTREVEKYLDAHFSEQPSPGFDYPVNVLLRLRTQLGYSFAMDAYAQSGKNNRAAQSFGSISDVREQIRSGEDPSQEHINSGYADLVQDPELSQAYERFGTAATTGVNTMDRQELLARKKAATDQLKAMETAPADTQTGAPVSTQTGAPAGTQTGAPAKSVEELQKDADLDPYDLFSNSLVEYDSTMNECYFICLQLGVDKKHPGDPLFQMIKQAAKDAYEYRERYRKNQDFTSVTSYKDAHPQ